MNVLNELRITYVVSIANELVGYFGLQLARLCKNLVLRCVIYTECHGARTVTRVANDAMIRGGSTHRTCATAATQTRLNMSSFPTFCQRKSGVADSIHTAPSNKTYWRVGVGGVHWIIALNVFEAVLLISGFDYYLKAGRLSDVRIVCCQWYFNN